MSDDEKRPFLYYLEGKEPVAVPADDADSGVVWWASWMHAAAYSGVRSVGLDQVGDRVLSTVFLGIDSSGYGPPMLFETMILSLADKPPVLVARYGTWEEAEEGHEKARRSLQ